MKKLSLILLLSFFAYVHGQAQETSNGKSQNSFNEFNFGLAYISDENFFSQELLFFGGKLISMKII